MELIRHIVRGLLLLSLLAAPVAYARSAVPIEDHIDIPIATANGKKASAEQVRQAIIAGGARKAWTFADSGAAQLTGTLVVRDKHSVVVTIDYGPSSYSIHYKDSSNMKYANENGIPVIHPFYNKWIDNLILEINVELTKL